MSKPSDWAFFVPEFMIFPINNISSKILANFLLFLISSQAAVAATMLGLQSLNKKVKLFDQFFPRSKSISLPALILCNEFWTRVTLASELIFWFRKCSMRIVQPQQDFCILFHIPLTYWQTLFRVSSFNWRLKLPNLTCWADQVQAYTEWETEGDSLSILECHIVGCIFSDLHRKCVLKCHREGLINCELLWDRELWAL